ncbi:glyoxylate reductase/hydroxypyruvate reductase-like [Saccostrea echinata]|uniref:glyoxylate reductase/hydroxypyruvate reductase-like n=1 Tax=Saccostrea echinata TaxID=191078 RepID=UPI002A828289|nr:glyoxylate reductase/hydroxypyruvate reductase-like [Saccostrea echinata]
MSQRYKVYVTRRIPDPGTKLLGTCCDVTFWDSDDVIPRKELLKNVKGVDAILCMLTDKINDEVLEHAGPKLQVVSTMSVGYEHIDLKACQDKGIAVTNTPNVSSDSVAELTVALVLLTARRLLEGAYAVKNGNWGKWRPMWLCGVEMKKRTLGIMGLGRIGYGVAKRMRPFGVGRIVYHDVQKLSYDSDFGGEYVEFEDLAKESDILCICCNLNPQTKHLFNKDTFQIMKNSAILINTGRGGVINHVDLFDALTSNQIAAAGLDVTDPEPLPVDHPLLTLNNCVILPHMGSNTWESRNRMAEIAAENVITVLNNGHPKGEVLRRVVF